MTIKKCTSCEIEKSLEEFSKKSKNRLQSKCKDCTKIYLKDHYLKNKEYYVDKAQRHNRFYRKSGRQFIWDYLKEHPCVDCGEKDPIVLEFDHFRDKEYDISSMVHKSISIKKIQSEIDKCEVRCANCHRRKTAKQLNWHSNINK